MKRRIKLSEENVMNIIKESVKRVLKEAAGAKLPYLVRTFDKSRANEYSEFDRLIVRLYPIYLTLAKDTFGYGDEPSRNQASLMACTSMQVILNDYLGGKYLERIRGGADVIVTNGRWFNGEYDLTDEYYNYALGVVQGAPEEVDDLASKIAFCLEHGILYDAKNNFEIQNYADEKAADEAERAKNGGLKVVGKIQLGPEDLNKKRW